MASLPPRPPPTTLRNAPLAPGWTEHKAPTGHSYYYNAATKTSTYSRPVAQPPPPPHPTLPPAPPSIPGYYGGAAQFGAPPTYTPPGAQYNAPPTAYNAPPTYTAPTQLPDVPFNASSRGGPLPPQKALAQQLPHRPHAPGAPFQPAAQRRPPPKKQQQPQDKPKKKRDIPGAEPWLLIITKLGRKFVHNPETKESLWNAPAEVQEKIDAMPPPDVEAERAARQERRRRRAEIAAAENAKAAAEARAKAAAERAAKQVAEAPAGEQEDEDDEDEYEYVEEEEEEESPEVKRAKLEDGGPIEYTEDDIAWQLQAMAEEHELDPEDLEEQELDPEESANIFKEMLSEYSLNPYSTWELELPKFVEDHRYTILSTTKDRRDIFNDWCRERIAELKAEKARQKQIDPRIPFWSFLKSNANPKYYWAEFKRKHRKDPEMKDSKLSDKDREKMYRDYLARMKTSGTLREADLKKLLNTTHGLSSRTALTELPDSIVADVRYVVCPDESRDRIIRDHLRTLPEEAVDEAVRKEREDAARREAALRDREFQVRRQQASTRYDDERARMLLREEEAALERASRVGKRGLAGHLRTEKEKEEEKGGEKGGENKAEGEKDEVGREASE